MPSQKVKTLERKRPCYNAELWKEYNLLYHGGKKLKDEAAHFLVKNQVETKSWFKERVKRFTYKNIIGAIVDDYAATVLQEPLELNLEKKDGAKERPEADDFYLKELWPDPTGTGDGDLNDLAFQVLTGAMAKREAWVMVTKPEAIPGFDPTSLAEQEAAGQLRFMLRMIEPENVINCHADQNGLAWAMLRFRYGNDEALQEIKPGDKPMETVQWTLLTRTHFQTWTIKVKEGEEPKEKDTAQQETEETEHHLSEAYDGLGAVPVRCFKLSDTLWLMDRVSLLVIEELRKRNALGWYETLSAFPQLCHAGDEELGSGGEDGSSSNTARGAQYLWEIGKDATLEWLEPAGASLEHLRTRLDALEKDIYKGVAQMAAAQGPGAAAALQSGASKVRDSVAKSILCERYAARLRTEFKELAELVSAARGDKYAWEAGGASRYDLQDGEIATKNASVSQTLTFSHHSPTFTKAMAMRTARALLPDASTEMLDEIEKEIEAMPVEPPDEGMEGLGNRPQPGPGGQPKPKPVEKPKPKQPPAKPGKEK
jgi:hypothetical protein